MVDHPAVLAETRRDHGRPRAQLRDSDGLSIVVYQRPRVYVDRDAWEMLPADGVLLMRVRPTGEPGFDLAFTRDELENVFGEVRETRSWEQVRCYHFPNTPRAVESFRVPGDGPGGAGPTHPLRTETSALRGRPSRPLTAGSYPASAESSARSVRAMSLAPRGSAPVLSRLEWARGWFVRLGASGESDAYLRAVEAWRAVWRPDRIKVLLLAESHVAEAPGDADIRVQLPPTLRPQRQLPALYVRLVYCLGYGDDSVCFPPPSVRNTGTKDYWEIFERIAAATSGHSGALLPAHPLARKIAILEQLASRGIWLEDASPLGIYRAGGGSLTTERRTLNLIEREAYTRYVWPGVADDAPEHVWTIGRTVRKALHGLPGIRADHEIMQPSYARRAGAWDEYQHDLDELALLLAVAAP
jgi:hypothetical protein